MSWGNMVYLFLFRVRESVAQRGRLCSAILHSIDSGRNAMTPLISLIANMSDFTWVDWVKGTNNLPMTREMQAILFLHQNPMNCLDKRFLIWKMFNSGLGNDLHILSWALAAGVQCVPCPIGPAFGCIPLAFLPHCW